MPERCDAARNRARILEAARDLFAERDAADVSMDAIAAAAGVGKGTLFRRFGSRSGLARALAREYMDAFLDACREGPPPLGPGAAPAERLVAFFDGLLDLHAANLPIALAHAAAGEEGEAVKHALFVHARALLTELDRELDADVMADLLLSASGPPTVDRLRRHGAGVEDIRRSVHRLLAGLSR